MIPSRILIVKTSSLGDIIQAFPVLDYLSRRFPSAILDWAVEERFFPLVSAHPLVNRAIPLSIKQWRQWRRDLSELRKSYYDCVFDLQGNCKSGVVTLLAKGGTKVGFGRDSVREWPNLLATHCRFDVPKQINMRWQYVELVQRFFKDSSAFSEWKAIRLRLSSKEEQKIAALLSLPSLEKRPRIMICPGSKWKNKQLSLETLRAFLHSLQKALAPSFLFIWGEERERALCEALCAEFPHSSCVVERLSLPAWQHLMSEVDLVFAVDSSALHLCGTTTTPSFSVFGPTSAQLFKPIGPRHGALQGKCPYERSFEKTCPILRSCATGACIRQLNAEEIARSFLDWWRSL